MVRPGTLVLGRSKFVKEVAEIIGIAEATVGAWTLPGSPADCGKLIVEEIEKWAKVVRAGNIKPE